MEALLEEIGHTHSIEKGLLSDSFMEWYVSLCNNTDTMKYEFNASSNVVKRGKQNPDFLLRDTEIEQLRMPVLWLDHPKEHAVRIMEFLGNQKVTRMKKETEISVNY